MNNKCIILYSNGTKAGTIIKNIIDNSRAGKNITEVQAANCLCDFETHSRNERSDFFDKLKLAWRIGVKLTRLDIAFSSAHLKLIRRIMPSLKYAHAILPRWNPVKYKSTWNLQIDRESKEDVLHGRQIVERNNRRSENEKLCNAMIRSNQKLCKSIGRLSKKLSLYIQTHDREM